MKTKNFKRFFLLSVLVMIFTGQIFAATKYEAENATLAGTAANATSTSASNGAYVKLNNGSITFSTNVETKGIYTLTIHYQNNYGGSKTNYINVGGTKVGELTFTEATTFTDIETTVNLAAGKNEIAITSSWGYIDVDYIELSTYVPTSFNISTTPVTAGATDGAKKLYKFLYDNFEKKTISGVMTGDITSGTGILTNSDVAAVYNASGKYPALVGFDFLFASGIKQDDSWYQSYTNNTLSLAKELWSKGGIPAYTWHWKDPSDQVDAFYVSSDKNPHTDFDFTQAFKTGTTEWDTESDTYKQIVEDIDHISDLFIQLQDAGVAAIFRPVHESGGTWFWWSTHTGADFAALYRLIYDRMVNTNGVKNLVWVFNPQDASYTDWNPGEAYYDILSVDIYNNAYDNSSNYSAFNNLKDKFGVNKILALSENGPIPDVNNMYDDNATWSWWMPWYETWSGGFVSQTSNTVWASNMADERIITLDEMTGWGTSDTTTIDPCKSDDPLKFEAECADYSGTVETASCMSGTGGINLTTDSSYIKFSISSEENAAYKIYVGYNVTYGGGKIVNCAVNGVGSDAALGSSDDENGIYGEVLAGSYSFKAGENEVIVTPGWTWAVVDYIRLETDSSAKVYNFEPSDVDGFKVNGSKLLDRCNNEFIMRGVNMAYTWYVNSAYDQLSAIHDAGANAVRIVLSDGKGYSKAADAASDVKAIADKCKEYGMVAILEVHDETGSDDIEDLEDAANYLAGLADVLKGTESYIILNIANEWHNSSAASNWKDGYVAAIPIIRNAGLRHCIMVDAGGYGQSAATIHSYGLEVMDADTEHNVIFSIHMYGNAGNTNKIKTNIDGVINQDLALCIGEFGWYHSDGDVDEDLILSYCTEKKVGWLAWSWYGNGSPVEYLDVVSNASSTAAPASYKDISISSWDGSQTFTASCDWGKKIIDAWAAEAKSASLDECSTDINEKYAEKESFNTYFSNDGSELTFRNSEEGRILISDVMGRIFINKNFSVGEVNIDTTNWANGVYIVSFNGESVKVIK